MPATGTETGLRTVVLKKDLRALQKCAPERENDKRLRWDQETGLPGGAQIMLHPPQDMFYDHRWQEAAEVTSHGDGYFVLITELEEAIK